MPRDCNAMSQRLVLSPDLTTRLSPFAQPSHPHPHSLIVMSGFDRNQVYVVPVHPAQPTVNGEKPSDTLEQLKQFITDFRVGHAFPYRHVASPSPHPIVRILNSTTVSTVNLTEINYALIYS